jgi:hypothetical protein
MGELNYRWWSCDVCGVTVKLEHNTDGGYYHPKGWFDVGVVNNLRLQYLCPSCKESFFIWKDSIPYHFEACYG